MTDATFTAGPGSYSWTVPTGVASIGVSAWGAGCNGFDLSGITTTPGETLTVVLGGAPAADGTGGYNGGGNGVRTTAHGPYTASTGGCGATELRRGTDPLFVLGGLGGIVWIEDYDTWENSGATAWGSDLLKTGAYLSTLPGTADPYRHPNYTYDASAPHSPDRWEDLSTFVAGGTQLGADGQTISPGTYSTAYGAPGGLTFHLGAGGGGYGGGGGGVLTSQRDLSGGTPVWDRFLRTGGYPGGSWIGALSCTARESGAAPAPQGYDGYGGVIWNGAMVIHFTAAATSGGWTVGSVAIG